MTLIPGRPPLTFASYQDLITRGHDGDREHQALAILGEVGELANKVKKVRYYGRPQSVPELMDEAGDVLAYTALAAAAWGLRLADIAGCSAFESLEVQVAAQYQRLAEPLHVHVIHLGRAMVGVLDAAVEPNPFADNSASALYGVLRRLALIAHAMGVPFEDIARGNMAKVAERFPDRVASTGAEGL